LLIINAMGKKPLFHKMLEAAPYFGPKLRLLDDCGYPPGHYYSTIPDLHEIREQRESLFKKSGVEIRGIDLRKENQFELLQKFSKHYSEIPYDFETEKKTQTRYQTQKAWYRYSDVIMLYSMIREFNPQRIIEIGSGHSSAVMLDANDLVLESKATMTFIDPDTERLDTILTDKDKVNHQVIQSKIQDVNLEIFKSLQRNDILFIDSSHVSKIGSDLNHILFEILPRVGPGVLIHFHDIYFPFEMPEDWVLTNKWFWNENYILRAYLTDNSRYEIINFNSYLHEEFRDWFKINMPACLISTHDTGSIWIRKV